MNKGGGELGGAVEQQAIFGCVKNWGGKDANILKTRRERGGETRSGGNGDWPTRIWFKAPSFSKSKAQKLRTGGEK